MFGPKSGPKLSSFGARFSKTRQRSKWGLKVDQPLTWLESDPNSFWLTRPYRLVGEFSNRKKKNFEFSDFPMAWKAWADFLVFSKMKISWVSNFFQISPSSGDKTYCFFLNTTPIKRILWKIVQIIKFYWFIGNIADFIGFIGIIGLFPVSEFGYFNTLF